MLLCTVKAKNHRRESMLFITLQVATRNAIAYRYHELLTPKHNLLTLLMISRNRTVKAIWQFKIR